MNSAGYDERSRRHSANIDRFLGLLCADVTPTGDVKSGMPPAGFNGRPESPLTRGTAATSRLTNKPRSPARHQGFLSPRSPAPTTGTASPARVGRERVATSTAGTNRPSSRPSPQSSPRPLRLSSGATAAPPRSPRSASSLSTASPARASDVPASSARASPHRGVVKSAAASCPAQPQRPRLQSPQFPRGSVVKMERGKLQACRAAARSRKEPRAIRGMPGSVEMEPIAEATQDELEHSKAEHTDMSLGHKDMPATPPPGTPAWTGSAPAGLVDSSSTSSLVPTWAQGPWTVASGKEEMPTMGHASSTPALDPCVTQKDKESMRFERAAARRQWRAESDFARPLETASAPSAVAATHNAGGDVHSAMTQQAPMDGALAARLLQALDASMVGFRENHNIVDDTLVAAEAPEPPGVMSSESGVDCTVVLGSARLHYSGNHGDFDPYLHGAPTDEEASRLLQSHRSDCLPANETHMAHSGSASQPEHYMIGDDDCADIVGTTESVSISAATSPPGVGQADDQRQLPSPASPGTYRVARGEGAAWSSNSDELGSMAFVVSQIETLVHEFGANSDGGVGQHRSRKPPLGSSEGQSAPRQTVQGRLQEFVTLLQRHMSALKIENTELRARLAGAPSATSASVPEAASSEGGGVVQSLAGGDAAAGACAGPEPSVTKVAGRAPDGGASLIGDVNIKDVSMVTQETSGANDDIARLQDMQAELIGLLETWSEHTRQLVIQASQLQSPSASESRQRSLEVPSAAPDPSTETAAEVLPSVAMSPPAAVPLRNKSSATCRPGPQPTVQVAAPLSTRRTWHPGSSGSQWASWVAQQAATTTVPVQGGSLTLQPASPRPASQSPRRGSGSCCGTGSCTSAAAPPGSARVTVPPPAHLLGSCTFSATSSAPRQVLRGVLPAASSSPSMPARAPGLASSYSVPQLMPNGSHAGDGAEKVDLQHSASAGAPPVAQAKQERSQTMLCPSASAPSIAAIAPDAGGSLKVGSSANINAAAGWSSQQAQSVDRSSHLARLQRTTSPNSSQAARAQPHTSPPPVDKQRLSSPLAQSRRSLSPSQTTSARLVNSPPLASRPPVAAVMPVFSPMSRHPRAVNPSIGQPFWPPPVLPATIAAPSQPRGQTAMVPAQRIRAAPPPAATRVVISGIRTS